MKKILLILVVFLANNLIAQSTISIQKRTPSGKIRCATNEYESFLKRNEPDRETRQEFEQWITPKIEEARRNAALNRSTNVIITIPVVVHIISNGDAIGVNENITNAQALSQITVLNQDFRKMVGTPGYNSNAVGADIEIEFCMAQRKPDGTATTGIDRVTKTTAQYASFASVETLKTQTIWDSTNYFNIWTVYFSDSLSAEMNGTLGYAQFPSSSGLSGMATNGGAANTDGLVVDYRCFGSSVIAAGPYYSGYNLGRTATHEIGHCFGLIHIWGDGTGNPPENGTPVSDCSATDYCADTPQAGYEHYSCGTFDTCPSAAGNDMPENYMDYSPDSCMNIFTVNQKSRITTVMNNSPRRLSLKTSLACSAPLAINGFEVLNNIQLFPNPANDLIKIQIYSNEIPEKFYIYNSLGQLVINKVVNDNFDLNIDISTFSAGVYFIQIYKGNANKTLRFIKL